MNCDFLKHLWSTILLCYGLLDSNLEYIEEAINITTNYRNINVSSYVFLTVELGRSSYLEKILGFGLPNNYVVETLPEMQHDSIYDDKFACTS